MLEPARYEMVGERSDAYCCNSMGTQTGFSFCLKKLSWWWWAGAGTRTLVVHISRESAERTADKIETLELCRAIGCHWLGPFGLGRSLSIQRYISSAWPHCNCHLLTKFPIVDFCVLNSAPWNCSYIIMLGRQQPVWNGHGKLLLLFTILERGKKKR
jgi:hypothetical protein